MQAVPLGFFLFLVELAAGGLIVTALLDWDGEVSGGYLFLNGIFMLGAAAAGVWLRSVLPAARLWPAAAESPWQRAELAAWALFAVVAATQLFCIRTDRRRAGRALGVLAGACGLAAIAVSSLTYGSHTFGAVGLAVSLIAGALVLGTAWSGMMLGHWYLVTPLLAPRPLLRLNAGFAAVLVFQGVWALLPLAAGGFDQPLAGLYALRIGVGIAAPLAITLPIWRTARVRSMMSATGLLYVALGLVLAGEIIAKALFFIAGTPT
jgi:hypothetical protein